MRLAAVAGIPLPALLCVKDFFADSAFGPNGGGRSFAHADGGQKHPSRAASRIWRRRAGPRGPSVDQSFVPTTLVHGVKAPIA